MNELYSPLKKTRYNLFTPLKMGIIEPEIAENRQFIIYKQITL